MSSSTTETINNTNSFPPIKTVMETYFKLRNQYTTSIDASVYKSENDPLTLKERRTAYTQLPPPKCVNCHRPVGTIFTVTPIIADGNHEARNFTAKCGDPVAPCPLNINFTISALVHKACISH